MNFLKISKSLIFLVPFSVIFVVPQTLFPFIVGKYVWFRGAVLLSFIFFLLSLWKEEPQDKLIKTVTKVIKRPLTIAVGVFVFFFVLAGFFGISPENSFWSNFERGEGGFQMIALFIFFLLAQLLLTTKNDWHKFFAFSIVAASLMTLYGVGAGIRYTDAEFTVRDLGNGSFARELTGKGGLIFHSLKRFIGPSFSEANYRFQGSLGNPAYVATYLIFALFYAAYLFMIRKSAKILSIKNISLLLAGLLFLAFSFLAATRGAFVALGVSLLSGLIFVASSQKKWRKKVIIATALIILIVSLVSYLVNSKENKSYIAKLPMLRVLDLSFYAETFQHRILMWGIAWRGFLARPILGWGPENFIQVFDRYYDPKYFKPGQDYGAWFDRAHSIIFDYLAETGILGFLSFCAIFFVFYRQFFKSLPKSPDNRSLIKYSLVFSLPVFYLVQGLVLFDVLSIYLNFFTFMAFASVFFSNHGFHPDKKQEDN